MQELLAALLGNPLLDEHRRVGPIPRRHPVRQRLVHRYAYGIPNDAALEAIAAISPAGVVELGAGTGYWARLLHDRGVDVVAYDRWPPRSGGNRFVDDGVTWFPVEAGDERVVIRHADRTLLLVWPTWNETWPADAVAGFHRAGGTRLAFVGEGPGGLTGDAALHARLGEYGGCVACSLAAVDAPCVCHLPALWRGVGRIDIPQWADADDACTLYERISAHEVRDPLRRFGRVLGRGPGRSTGRSGRRVRRT